MVLSCSRGASVKREVWSGIADPDGDGIPNSLEFVLGGLPSGAGANSTALLPKITTDATWASFEFRRADVALTVDPFAQSGPTVSAWSRANNGVNGVQITTVDDGFGPGVDRVTARVPAPMCQQCSTA